MPLYKVSFLFNTLVGPAAGWSETFYCTADAATPGELAGLMANSAIAWTRSDLLHPQYWFYGVRCTDVARTRKSRLNFFTPAEGIGTYPAVPAEGTSDPPYSAVNVYFSNGDTVHRSYHLHGLPYNITDDTFAYHGDLVPAWNLRYKKWERAMKGEAVDGRTAFTAQMLQQILGPKVTIAGVNPSPFNRKILEFTTRSLNGVDPGPPLIPPLALNRTIKISDVQNAANTNRLWKVATMTGPVDDVYSIQCYPHRQKVIGPVNGSGSYQVRITAGVNVVFTDPVGGVEKKVGRPFGAPSGRRPLQYT